MFILGINPLRQQYFHKMNLAVSFLNIILSFTVHGSLKCKIINVFCFRPRQQTDPYPTLFREPTSFILPLLTGPSFIRS